jgi:hypothetical protein
MPEHTPIPNEHDELHNEDFQAVLKALLAIYQPILEEQLRLAQQPDELKKQVEGRPPSCDDELALANHIFERFVTEEVAIRAFPAAARELLGPAQQWRWCLLHIRCCMIFGWLVCRGPRTFRALAYYLYRYWRCVREVLGTPVSNPPTAEEHQDFQVLVTALAGAYKPYLTDQLASVEFPVGIPDEVFGGKIDCGEGLDSAGDVFERLMQVDIGPALLGRKVFEEHQRTPFFWFCRCWCLCAIRLGCCLARANSLQDVVRCLLWYILCLRDCFRPLQCDILKPAMNSCAEEQYFPGPNVLGVEIIGTATGAFCSHYTLEWKDAAAAPAAYTQVGIVYASPAPPGGPGACGKVNAPLGYLNTASAPVPSSVSIRLCVYGAPGTQPCCEEVEFQIFRQRVWITSVQGVSPGPDGILDPDSQLMSGGVVKSFGTDIGIAGRAWVGECTNRAIKRYTLSYQPGFVVVPGGPGWTQFWQVDFITPLQRKEIPEGEFSLTSYWYFNPVCLPSPPFAPGTCFDKDWLGATTWWTGPLIPGTSAPTQAFPIDPQAGPTWTSQQVFPTNCHSGRYTIQLDVEDTLGFHYYDIQQIWLDNKEIHGKITQFAGVPPCSSLNLSQFAAQSADCSVPWPADLLGLAYDEYIIEGDASIPSDNFGGYELWIKKDGAPDPGVPLPVPGPGGPPWGPPFVGTARVGDPGIAEKCSTAVPAPPPGLELVNRLLTIDMRRLDAICNPGEPDLTLQRGECCGYVLRLLVWDNSVVHSGPGGRHQIEHHFPVCICNNLPPTG